MEPEGVQRRLAAILAADVAGYTRLMEADEDATLAAWWAARHDIVDPAIAEHGGRIVKHTGDGFLAEFATASEAVRCAVAMQTALAASQAEATEERRLDFRMGINLGEIVVDDEDIYGDGVNIAARIEALADAGGICVSGNIHEQVHKKLDLVFEDLGERQVKNVSAPIRVYRVVLDAEAAATAVAKGAARRKWVMPAAAAALVLLAAGFALWQGSPFSAAPGSDDFCQQKTRLAVPDKPSIAVLPFDNLSADPKQESFSDGLTEDIITTLAKVTDIFVISRNSSFTYKGKPVKVQQVAEELGVRYVLEGSVQRAGDRLRITAQLVDAKTGNHLWAERFERDAGDLFAVSDGIMIEILTALKVELTNGEMAKYLSRGTDNLEALLAFSESNEEFQRFSKDANEKSRALAIRATELDPNYSGGWVILGWTHIVDVFYGGDRSESIRLSMEFAEKALELDDTNPWVYSLFGYIALQRGEPEKAVELGRKAVGLNANIADSHAMLGLLLNYTGRPEEAIPSLKKAMRLSPYYPTFYLLQLGESYQRTDRNGEAVVAYRKLLCRSPDSLFAHLGLILSYGALDRQEEARNSAIELLKSQPDYSLAIYKVSVGTNTNGH